tara:strand:- start:752 stop:1195 length:444 start_codon:yes stop_codon:yes gene_type:complete
MGKKTKVKRIPGKVVVWSGKAAGMGWAYRIEGGPLDGVRSENKHRSKAMAIGAGRALKLRAMAEFHKPHLERPQLEIFRLYVKLPDSKRFQAMDYNAGTVVGNLVHATLFSAKEAGLIRERLPKMVEFNPGWQFELRKVSLGQSTSQ